MISRIVTVAVLSAGVAMFLGPAFAQGPAGRSADPGPGGMNSSGGATIITDGFQSRTAGMAQPGVVGATAQGAAWAPAVNQAQSSRRMGGRGTDAMERQVTECLNLAVANRTSFDACRR